MGSQGLDCLHNPLAYPSLAQRRPLCQRTAFSAKLLASGGGGV